MAGKSQEEPFIPSDIAALFVAAEELPSGKKRDKLRCKALELEARLKIERWINSSGLRPPCEL
jgi:hypothetical protein